MECLKRQEHIKLSPKSTLTFSIDKIIGCNDEDEHIEDQEEHKAAKVNSNQRNETFNIGGKENSSFQPVKRRADVLQDEKQTKNNQADAILKSEIRKRQLTSYFARDMYDVNMNAVPYLHPAFMLGRVFPEEYRAQMFQNLFALHNQWPNINKETLCSLELLRTHSEPKSYPVQANQHSNQHDQTVDRLKQRNEYKTTTTPKVKQPNSVTEVSKQGAKPVSTNSCSPDGNSRTDSETTSSNRKIISKAQKSFSCPECGKMFNAHYNLTRHMPVHTGKPSRIYSPR